MQAHWDSPEGYRFYFYYEWSALKAIVSLSLAQASECLPLDLLKSQHVRHLREAPAATRR
jgi:hypothetical protein